MASTRLVEKGKETTTKILEWLYLFKYSKCSILQDITGLSRSGIGDALKKLEKRGLLKSLKPTPPLKTVWGITWDGICHIGKTEESHKFEPSKFNELTAIHHYNIQQLKIILSRKGYNLIPLKRDSVGSSEKTPDGIIKKENTTIAIELERTVKTKSRYKNIWGGYIKDIRNGKYHQIQYFMPNQRTQNLPKIFNMTETIIIDNKSLRFTDELKSFFRFTDISDKV
jgi:hypothetical protein